MREEQGLPNANQMEIEEDKLRAQVELAGLDLNIEIGTYTNKDVVPDRHTIDLTLGINPGLVLIDKDQMDRIFDYDPLISKIQNLAEGRRYETQERFITLVVGECAKISEIESVQISFRKSPVSGSSGELGIRLEITGPDLKKLRTNP